MPIQALTITLEAFRHDFGRSVTHEEFITPLMIQPGEVEAACVFGEPRRSGEVRIASVRCQGAGVNDAEFDTWAADAFRAAVGFLERRPPSVTADMKASGLLLRICVEVDQIDGPAFIDWPSELYAACRRHGIGLVS